MKSDIGLKSLFILCIASILLGGVMIPLVSTGSNNVAIASSNISVMLSYCNSKTLYVGGTGPDNYTMIQDAIDASHAGDTIFVYSDSSPYYENLVIDKSLNLLGENRETTIIDGLSKETVVRIVVGNVTVQNFTVTNAECGVLVKKNISTNRINHVIITENIVIDNALEGIALWHCEYLAVYENHVQNNRWGVSLYGCHFTIVTRNNLIDNVTEFLTKENMHIYYWSDFYLFFTNVLSGNYWDNWIGIFPKPILASFYPVYPLIQFDWHPLTKPYEW